MGMTLYSICGITWSRNPTVFVCWLLFGVRSTPVLPKWHVKDPGHSAKSAGGRLHLNTHTPSTQPSQSGLTVLWRNNVEAYHRGNRPAHMQFIREHPATVISASWAIVVWFWHQKWNWWKGTDVHLIKKIKAQARDWIVKPSPKITTSEVDAMTTFNCDVPIAVVWVIGSLETSLVSPVQQKQ